MIVRGVKGEERTGGNYPPEERGEQGERSAPHQRRNEDGRQRTHPGSVCTGPEGERHRGGETGASCIQEEDTRGIGNSRGAGERTDNPGNKAYPRQGRGSRDAPNWAGRQV